MQNKIFSLFSKYIHILFGWLVEFDMSFFRINFKFMNPNKVKKNLTTEIKEKLKISKFDLLTNENDFLVKSLKKAG